ncbi:DUF4157 domain-containing protein [Nannocystis sp. ncelm1]|uniref:DUF4157 domain-containing protein n=1 Tax=Nannocystis radixulma TaxID=2995305 RepID=A0ABT5BQ68_9BACT|nr:DUF4157 domain-containing protein [Nannocystis radixulma]
MLNTSPGVTALQRKQAAPRPQPNNTGLPEQLKAGVESLSGISMDDVEVHYNSPKPAQLQALAYTQASEIHVAPGQEQHLPHEAWHVAQQKQGRVHATAQMKGVALNDEPVLEAEADRMGALAARGGATAVSDPHPPSPGQRKTGDIPSPRAAAVQRVPVRNQTNHRHAVRAHFVQTGDLDKSAITDLVARIGSTNLAEAGVIQVALLIRNGVTAAEVEAVFRAVHQADVPQMFMRAPALGNAALYRRLAAAPIGLVQDFFSLANPAAPDEQQIATWYGNYLALPGGPRPLQRRQLHRLLCADDRPTSAISRLHCPGLARFAGRLRLLCPPKCRGQPRHGGVRCRHLRPGSESRLARRDTRRRGRLERRRREHRHPA